MESAPKFDIGEQLHSPWGAWAQCCRRVYHARHGLLRTGIRAFECPTPGRLDSCADSHSQARRLLDYFNRPWLEYLGVTLDKVTGWNWTAVVHPEDVGGIVARWRACLATGEVFEYETRVRRANGEYRWMFHRKFHFAMQTATSLSGMDRVSILRNARRRKRSCGAVNAIFTRSSRRSQRLVWSAAPDGSVDFFNPRWLDYTGLSPDQSRDWRWTAAIHPDDLSRLNRCLAINSR